MNIEFAQRWVAALRSGRYKQGRSRLRKKDDTFCCLGVACDLLIQDGLLPPWEEGDDSTCYETYGFACGIPPKVLEHVGFDTYMGGLNSGQLEIHGLRFPDLASANDCHVPFAHIADFIESRIQEAENASHQIAG